jgi:hypothetical protein
MLQTVYFGAVAGCEQYFIEIGLEFPPRTNVADWLLDVVTADSEKQAAGEDSLSLVEEYNRSSQKARVDEQQTNLIATSHNCSNGEKYANLRQKLQMKMFFHMQRLTTKSVCGIRHLFINSSSCSNGQASSNAAR